MSDKNKHKSTNIFLFVILGIGIGLVISGIIGGKPLDFLPLLIYMVVLLVIVVVVRGLKAKKGKNAEILSPDKPHISEDQLKMLVAQYRALPPDQRHTPEGLAKWAKIRSENPTQLAGVKEATRAQLHTNAPNVSEADIDTMMEILFGPE